MKTYSVIIILQTGALRRHFVLLLAEIKIQSDHLPVTGYNNSNKWNHTIQALLIQYDFIS